MRTANTAFAFVCLCAVFSVQLHMDYDADASNAAIAQPKHNGTYNSTSKQGLYDGPMHHESQSKSDWKSEQELTSRRPRLVSNDDEPGIDSSPVTWGRHRLTSHSSTSSAVLSTPPAAIEETSRKSQIPLDGDGSYKMETNERDRKSVR